MGVAHAHCVLVDVDARLVDASELEFVHQVVVHLLAVDGCFECFRIERGEAVRETFLDEMPAHIQLVVRAYGDGHVDGAFPVGVGQHLEHHQLALVEGAFGVALFVFERDVHIVGDGVAQRCRDHHTRTAYGFFVDLDNDAVGRYHRLSVFGAYPVFQDILQFVRIVSELCPDVVQGFRVLAVQDFFFGGFVGFVYLLLEVRADGYVFVLSLHVFGSVPGDGQCGGVISRAFHLVDVPVRASVRKPSVSWLYHSGKVSLSPLV